MDLLSIIYVVMSQFCDANAIIDLWPTRPALAAAISIPEDVVTKDRVDKWARRGVIPARYWSRVMTAARAKGVALTADDLVAAHSAKVRAA